MTGDRSKRIRTNVQRVLRDYSLTEEESTPPAIYDAVSRVQRKIAEESMCLEGKTEITTYADQELYPFLRTFSRTSN